MVIMTKCSRIAYDLRKWIFYYGKNSREICEDQGIKTTEGLDQEEADEAVPIKSKMNIEAPIMYNVPTSKRPGRVESRLVGSQFLSFRQTRVVGDETDSDHTDFAELRWGGGSNFMRSIQSGCYCYKSRWARQTKHKENQFLSNIQCFIKCQRVQTFDPNCHRAVTSGVFVRIIMVGICQKPVINCDRAICNQGSIVFARIKLESRGTDLQVDCSWFNVVSMLVRSVL